LVNICTIFNTQTLNYFQHRRLYLGFQHDHQKSRKYFPIRNSPTGISNGRTLFSAIKRYTLMTNRTLVHIRYVVAKWHWDVFLSDLFRLNLSVPLHQCSIIAFILLRVHNSYQKSKQVKPGKLQTR